VKLDTKFSSLDELGGSSAKDTAGMQINIKRILARAIRFWYLIALSLLLSLLTAYLINRYSQRVYPVKAAIIIKENDENVGAKFLYDNELLNPYRNFYNEIYIMKSYPLLQEVLESLGYEISFHREGDIVTTEYYETEFPVKVTIVDGSKNIYGRQLYFVVNDDQHFTMQHVTDDDTEGKEFTNLVFGDTVAVNGYKLLVQKMGNLNEIRDKRFIVKFHNPISLAKLYSSRLSATWAEQGAAVVNLEISGPVAQKEIDFLNKFIERYQFYDVEKKNKAATMAMKFLDGQLFVIGDSLKQYEDQVENFKRKNIITNLEGETNRLYEKLVDFEDQKFQYKLTDNYYSYIEKLLIADQYEGVFTPSSVGITDNVIATLITEIITLQSQVNLYKSNRTKGVDKLEDNPRLVEMTQRIKYLKGDIRKTIENSRKTQQINVAFINDQIRLVEQQLKKLPRTERELVAIQRNYALRENLYVFLLQKRTEAGLSKASTTSDIMVVNPPMASGATSPKVSRNYASAVGLGLIIPLLIFVLLEVANTRIQSKDDIEKLTDVPVIGGIGHNIASDPLIVYRKPRSAMAESFRALRSNLNYFTGNKDKKVFMVTSSIPGEGKSFTTLNIATVLALAGKKTVILGADLRKPKLFDDLNLNNDIGLSQYLSDMVQLDAIIQKSEIEGLYLIAGGPMPPNPSELLLRPAMTKLLTELRERFDFVVIDTPPLTYVTDAFVLAEFVDHTLFVVRQDYTPKPALQYLQDFYRSDKLTKVSILFNDLRKSGLGYGYSGYGYGYGYGYSYGYGVYGNKKASGQGYYTD
jgi:capsular exopolysaccharide synthesis family protein